MEFIYTQQTNTVICEHEDNAFNKYIDVIDSYQSLFYKYNYFLRLELFWQDFKGNTSDVRIQFKNGYGCYVACKVVNNNNEIYSFNTGEYYDVELSASWNISSITRNWFKLVVCLDIDIDDSIKEIKEWLEIIKNQTE